MDYPRFRRARAHRFVRRATGTDLAVQGTLSTTWYELAAATNGPGTGGFDLTVEAQIGDVLEAVPNWLIGNQALNLYFDVATIVAAAPVNYFGSGGTATGGGVGGWRGETGVIDSAAGPAYYTVQAGDLASGKVTVRPMFRANVAATVKTVYSSADWPLFFALKNLGPADPE